MSDYRKDMGERLAAYRKQQHLTQEHLAEKLDISVKHYSELERGITGISVEGLISISEKLGLQIDYLLFGKQDASLLPKELIEAYNMLTEIQKEKLRKLLQLIDSL